MQIQLTGQAQEVVENLLAQGRFQSADEAVECALEFFQSSLPPLESLNAKLQEGLEDVEAGRVNTLESDEKLKLFFDDVKRHGRERLAEKNGP